MHLQHCLRLLQAGQAAPVASVLRASVEARPAEPAGAGPPPAAGRRGAAKWETSDGCDA